VHRNRRGNARSTSIITFSAAPASFTFSPPASPGTLTFTTRVRVLPASSAYSTMNRAGANFTANRLGRKSAGSMAARDARVPGNEKPRSRFSYCGSENFVEAFSVGRNDVFDRGRVNPPGHTPRRLVGDTSRRGTCLDRQYGKHTNRHPE
jgi:hypothetical protein